MLIADVIRKKRDGGELLPAEVRAFIAGVTDGSIPDYQTAALLMAIFFRGLDGEELTAWTDAMLRSGDVLDLSSIAAPKVDKHSTGGVGDKISLPLAPAVAVCGVAVPMVSGRGLGHTGGTLDKLESIPGFRVDLSVERFTKIVGELGACLIGQTERIAPADRKLYALRDVTGTVESAVLIASSIMSKKLAEGIDALVLDCKVGSGAFMKTPKEAHALAQLMMRIGAAAGKPVTALISDMSQPLGVAVGNANEVAESIAILRGGGPGDVRELTVALGAEMLLRGKVTHDREDAKTRIARALDDGTALERFRQIIVAQGGDPRVVDSPETILPRAPHDLVVTAPNQGHVLGTDAAAIGTAVVMLGGGRRTKDDQVDPSVGVSVHVRIAERVEAGQPLATIHYRDEASAEAARALIAGAFAIEDGPPVEPPPLVIEVLRELQSVSEST